jgi:SAM-dependent methyltransferase
MNEKSNVTDDRPTAIPSDFNGCTLAGYEACALDYAEATAPRSDAGQSPALGKLLTVVGRGCRLLEIGSGPGWDADWLEDRGVHVRRTDATEAFVRFQNSRGKVAERLNVLTDRLDGPYDAILALYVLQHIDRSALPQVFSKLSHALRDGGAFLFSIREGHGEVVEKGSEGRSYYVALWQLSELVAALAPLGCNLLWSESSEDAEGKWLITLFAKDSHDRDASIRRAA